METNHLALTIRANATTYADRIAMRIAVPPRLAMAWLVDPMTGQVRAQHAEAYELR